MSSVSFSLTEKAVIDPILTLRAPPSPLEPAQTASWTEIVWQGAQSEVIARVLAIFASVFAVADASIHFSTGIYKGACLLARASYNKSDVYGHFRQAGWFAGFAIVGSVAGVAWPDIFKHCRYSPPAPSNHFPLISPPSIQKPPSTFREGEQQSFSDHFPDIPISIQKLATAVQGGEQQAPFDQLKQFWKQSPLEDKHWFVQVFSHDGTKSFKTVRTELADTVYRPVQHLKDRQVKWLSADEVDQRTSNAWKQASVCNRSFFYHATSERALESILKSKKVEVRHEKAFRGAFVSTQPETGFGRCILAFNRNIERLSSLEHGFQAGRSTYWAGFSRDIPVTDSTLAYIMLDGGTEEECRDLEARCLQWTGRPIQVVSLRDAEEHLASVQRLDMGIPSEWPSEDERMGQKILNTLRARAGVAVQNRVQPRVALATQQHVHQQPMVKPPRQPMDLAYA